MQGFPELVWFSVGPVAAPSRRSYVYRARHLQSQGQPRIWSRRRTAFPFKPLAGHRRDGRLIPEKTAGGQLPSHTLRKRSEERRVGQEGVSLYRSRVSADRCKKMTSKQQQP